MRLAPFCLAMLLFSSLTGCLADGDGDEAADLASVEVIADWRVGQWWLYTFTTPEWEDDSARLVVTEVDAEGNTTHMLGISSHREARRHAVLNHNPFLGRISHGNLSPFENGEPQRLFSFPPNIGEEWSSTLFGVSWNITTSDIQGTVVTYRAQGGSGEDLVYSYDASIGFLISLARISSDGTILLRMSLVASGLDHEGDVWFIRAGDLYSAEWNHDGGLPDAEIRDTFLVSGHPDQGDWDEMIYWLDARMGGGASTSSLTLRDHASVTALARTWGPGAQEEGQLGTIPYPSGEYTLTLTQSGESYVRLIVAGGITSHWTV